MKNSDPMTSGQATLILALYVCVLVGVLTAWSLNVVIGALALVLCFIGPQAIRADCWTLTWKNAVIMALDIVPVLILMRALVVLPQQPMGELGLSDFLAGPIVFVFALVAGLIMKAWLLVDIAQIPDR